MSHILLYLLLSCLHWRKLERERERERESQFYNYNMQQHASSSLGFILTFDGQQKTFL
jgi:hypothetical protein